MTRCIASPGRRLAALVVVTTLASLAWAPHASASIRSGDKVDGVTPKELGLPKAAMPDVTMDAGVLVTEDGRVLWSRSPDQRRAMASITKIMTAVVALENSTPDELVKVPRRSAQVGESTAFLRVGERLRMSEMLEGLMVHSGNDAAVAIAEHVGGSQDGFVKMMNAKAKELGLGDTQFKNPHGLDQAGHRTSANDLAVLARYAMTKPEFRAVVKKKSVRVGGKGRPKVENTNLLLKIYSGANGVKTGWTNDAGYSVINSARRDGVELYAVVLGTRSEIQRFTDARELLDFGFAHYRPQRLGSAGTVVGEAPVTDYLDVTVPAAISEDTTVGVFDLAGPITRSVRVTATEAPVKAGDRVGIATFTQRGEVVASIPLVATVDVDDPSIIQRVGIGLVRVWRRLTGASLYAPGTASGTSAEVE